jgi:acyl-CoA synthetase (AMP-forming)/AMP-acid ligase II
MLYATVFDMLQAQAEQRPQAIALQAPQRPPLSYGQLFNHLTEIITQLNHFGIGRNDRVAIVLPNGPEMVTTFLGVAAAATCAPLNPN